MLPNLLLWTKTLLENSLDARSTPSVFLVKSKTVDVFKSIGGFAFYFLSYLRKLLNTTNSVKFIFFNQTLVQISENSFFILRGMFYKEEYEHFV